MIPAAVGFLVLVSLHMPLVGYIPAAACVRAAVWARDLSHVAMVWSAQPPVPFLSCCVRPLQHMHATVSCFHLGSLLTPRRPSAVPRLWDCLTQTECPSRLV